MKDQATVTTDRPDWAPDNCPPSVIKMIDDEQYLETLGVRGLASADAAELHKACGQLRRQLERAFQAGKKSRRWVPAAGFYLVAGYVCGLLSAAVAVALFGGP